MANATIPAAKLLQILQANQLIEKTRLDALLATLSPEVMADTATLANAIATAKLLSKFQLALLTSGKSRSLMVAGKYRIIDRLGAGGMGLVYLCEHIRMKRAVALKVLPQKAAKEPGTLARFMKEAQIAASLRHPNIVQAYDTDQDGGIHYFVMEYVDGVDLERLVKKIGPLSPVRAANYITQTAEGLQEAANQGMVHRDIKPANLLVDRDGVIKILDLGLARVFDDDQDLTQRFDQNSVIGTVDYIAPEQVIDSHNVDSRADIYSLGITFYFLLTGKTPFRDATTAQKLMMHQMREMPSVRELNPAVPEGMARIISKMVAKKREDRYQSPIEVADALQKWTSQPVPPPNDDEIPPKNFMIGSGSGGSSISGRSAPTSLRHRPNPQSSSASLRRQALQQKTNRNVTMSLVAAGCCIALVAIFVQFGGKSTTENRLQPEITTTTTTPSAPVERLPGFSRIDVGPSVRQSDLKNGQARLTEHDVWWLSGEDKEIIKETEPTWAATLRPRLIGKRHPILPFAFFTHPTVGFATLNPEGRVLPTETVINPAEIDRESNVHWTTPPVLEHQFNEVNSITCGFGPLSARINGTTLRVRSGAMLLHGPNNANSTVIGGGPNRLTLDFNQHPATISIISQPTGSQSAHHVHVKAQLAGLTNQPLILSGTPLATVSIDKLPTDIKQLVIQGLVNDEAAMFEFQTGSDFANPQHRFPVVIGNARVNYSGSTKAEVRQSIRLLQNQIAQFHVDTPTKTGQIPLWLYGPISGSGRLIKSGNQLLMVMNPQNDYSGGTVVTGGNLSIQTRDGTPLGTGSVIIRPNAGLSGAGRIPGGITMEAGSVVVPGNDDGYPLHVSNRWTIDPKQPACRFQARLTNQSKTLAMYDGTAPLDWSNVTLEIVLVPPFQPIATTKMFLVHNLSSNSSMSNFLNALPDGRVRSNDRQYSARIGYQGNAATGNTTGGNDIVLFDWLPESP